MEEQPTPTGDNGRDTTGRFRPGNKLAKGNPFAKRVQKIRAALLSRLTVDDAKEIADVLIRQAKSGDLAAIKELLDRAIGKAPTIVAGADGGPLQIQAVDRTVFDAEGFARQLQQLAAEQSNEARRLPGNGEE